ncbi:hypothetical protein JCM8097_007350 [Rhodosporidiobolus ruineniae]
MSRTIAIIGSTGAQGSSVVRSLLSSSQDVSLRALTRDPTSDAVKALPSDSRLTLVKADLEDVESVKKALEGVQAVFAMTVSGPGEIAQGRNLVDACKAAGVEHLVFSSLPSIAQASGGKFTGVLHYEMKAQVEQYAKEQLANVTVVVPGIFYSHLARPFYTQRQADGTVRFCMSTANSDLSVGFLDASDVGVFVSAILSKPVSATAGKTYPIMSAPSGQNTASLAAAYAAKTGEKVVVEPISKEEVTAMLAGMPHGEVVARAANDLSDYLDSTPAGTTCYGTLSRVDDPTAADLGVKATTFEEWLEKSGWRA